MNARAACVALLWALLAAPACAIDVWDQTGEDDNSVNTDNVLLHGDVQVHDLAANAGVADEDWFLVPVPPYSSVEVTVNGVTGDLFDATNFTLTRRTVTNTVQQSAAQVYGLLTAKRLTWYNDNAFGQTFYVRVGDASCGTACLSRDQYTIRVRETQIALARFNNSGTQVTVLLVQNTTNLPIYGKVYFWNAAGTLLSTYGIDNLPAKALVVLPTQTVVPGVSGSITIAHDGQHYGLNAKAVALEPATGFSFDTPGVVRP